MKHILTFLGLIILCNSFFAQKFSIEPNLGINIMPFPKTGTGVDHKIGFAGTVSGKYEVIDNLTINLGIGISDRRLQYQYYDTISLLESYRTLLQTAGVDVDEIDSTLQATGIYLNQFNKTFGVANLLHFEIPVSVTYQWKSIQFNAGGYVGFRLKSTKIEEVTSNVPILQTIDLSAIDTTGTLSFFFPPAYKVSSGVVSNEDNLDKLIYGIRLGIGYSYDSHLSFNASYNLDLNTYAIETDNEITNNKYFIRLGMAYNIFSLNQKENTSKPKFE